MVRTGIKKIKLKVDTFSQVSLPINLITNTIQQAGSNPMPMYSICAKNNICSSEEQESSAPYAILHIAIVNKIQTNDLPAPFICRKITYDIKAETKPERSSDSEYI
jgi:hypothetical protein